MFEVGEVFAADGIGGSERHPCVLITPWDDAGKAVIVNFTDIRAVEYPSVTFQAGDFFGHWRMLKDSTIAYSYAKIETCAYWSKLLSGIRRLGFCDPHQLQEIRLGLLNCEDTPPQVLAFCKGLRWRVSRPSS